MQISWYAKKLLTLVLPLALLVGTGEAARAAVSARPNAVSFGNETVGVASKAVALTLINNSRSKVKIVSISMSLSQFLYSGPSAPITLRPNQGLVGTVTFNPSTAQTFEGTLVFTQANGTPITVKLSGTGIQTQAVQSPFVTTQPASVTITAGQTTMFSVTATGTAPLSYQWSMNGTAISGATSSSYTTPAETTAASGAQFTVVVSNSVGSVTSNAATLTVNPAPVAPTITTQPASVTITAGQTATFSVVATGTAPLSYQWRQNGTAISGATASSYTTPAETTAASGAQFTVTVTNSAGSATSNAATLTVNPAPVAPTITTQPSSQTITAGQTATFSVTATGTAPLSYQWSMNGTAIGGATASSYTTPVETTAASGEQFTVMISNSFGSATSNAATLTVNPAPGALTPSTTSLNFNNVIVGANSTLSMTFTNSGSVNITVSNVTISGAGLTASGVSNGQIITPGQQVTLGVTFTPAATGSVTGSFTVTSNASNSPTTISLTGMGIPCTGSCTSNGTVNTPTLVQSADCSELDGDPITAPSGTFSCRFPQPTLGGSGDVIVGGFVNDNTQTRSWNISDDGSNSYTYVTKSDATNNELMTMFYVVNDASTQRVIFTSNSSGAALRTPWIEEWTGVGGGFDQSSPGNNASSTTVTAGSATPAVTGELIVQQAVNDTIGGYSAGASTFTAGSQSNITWNLTIHDSFSAVAVQTGVYSSTSAINPTMSETAAGFVSLALFFKPGTGPAIPSGLWVNSLKHLWLTGPSSPFTVSFPCPSSDNVAFYAFTGNPTDGDDTTAITIDGHSMTETHASTSDGVTIIHNYYAENVTLAPSQMLVISGNFQGANAMAYCFASSSPASSFQSDNVQQNHGLQSGNSSTLPAGVPITPTSAGDLLFVTTGIANNTTYGLTGTGQYFMDEFWSSAVGNSNQLDQGNGFGFMLAPNTSSQSFAYDLYFTTSDPVGNWISEADEFH